MSYHFLTEGRRHNERNLLVSLFVQLLVLAHWFNLFGYKVLLCGGGSLYHLLIED